MLDFLPRAGGMNLDLFALFLSELLAPARSGDPILASLGFCDMFTVNNHKIAKS